MRKVILCTLVACFGVSAAYAGVVKGADCLREFSPSNNNWMARSNEYLFPTEKDYKKAVNRGTVYECDNNQCADGTYVEVNAGHYFDGRYRDYSAIYKCVAPTVGNDRWEKVNSKAGLTKCTHTRDRWGWTGSDSDEYLYPTKEDYDAVTKTEYGLVYECDSNVCKQGTEVVLNSVHYFGKKKVTTEKRYVCVTKGGGDYWMELSGDGKVDPLPPDPPISERCAGGFELNQLMETKNCADVATSDADLKTGKVCKKVCLKNTNTNEVKGMWYISECPKGTTPVEANYTSITPHHNHMFERCDKNNKPSACEVYRVKYPERYACCKAGKATKWEGDEANGRCICLDNNKEWKNGQCVNKGNQTCETLWTGNDEAIACCKAQGDWVDGKCVCKDDKDWKYDTATKNGICIAKDKPSDDKPTDDKPAAETDCVYTFNMDIKCKNGNTYHKGEQRKLTAEEAKKIGGCDSFKSQMQSVESLLAETKREITSMQELVKLVCKDDSITVIMPVVVGPDAKQVADAKSKISSFFTSAESGASVWRDAEGKFNTARLASDLTAGVVLGTVGGVVSGVVIKKKQVEKGFDALHCTVGGQTVADWGDEFSVGLR